MSLDVIFHVTEGSGPPVLLLNGVMMSVAAWEPVATLLTPAFRLIRCDLRGQLLSPGVAPPSVFGHAADIIRLLERLDLEAVHVAGTSFGAVVGLTLAAEHPRRVRSLTAITATDRMTPSMWSASLPLLAAVERSVQGEAPEAVFDLVAPVTFSPAWRADQADAMHRRRSAVAALPRAWFSGLSGLLRSVEGLDLRRLLPSITSPLLVVGASEDRMFPPEYSQAIGDNVPGARVVMLDGAPHGAVVERPGEIATLIRDFVLGVERNCG